MYSHGRGVQQDYAEALRWYRKAADQGDAFAQYELGYMYHHGYGVSPDYAEAARWYRKAADQGNTASQVSLGLMYNQGMGVPQDYVSAHMWFNLAAASGYAGAANSRDDVATKMTPEQVAEAQRLAREWKPKPSR
jgi:TPR repeat protein